MTATITSTTTLVPQYDYRLLNSPAGAALLQELIAKRAYAIWQARGCPSGTAVNDWFQAEAELRKEIQRAKRSRASR
jgi:hypothetical protein